MDNYNVIVLVGNVKVYLACKSRDSWDYRSMTKTFRIWTNDGEPKDIQADRVEFTKFPDGMKVVLFTGNKSVKFKDVLALTEVMPPLVIERKKWQTYAKEFVMSTK